MEQPILDRPGCPSTHKKLDAKPGAGSIMVFHISVSYSVASVNEKERLSATRRFPPAYHVFHLKLHRMTITR